MNISEAQKILDDLHNKYPKLKTMNAVDTAAFVRTLPTEEQKPIEAAAKTFELVVRQNLRTLKNNARFN